MLWRAHPSGAQSSSFPRRRGLARGRRPCGPRSLAGPAGRPRSDRLAAGAAPQSRFGQIGREGRPGRAPLVVPKEISRCGGPCGHGHRVSGADRDAQWDRAGAGAPDRGPPGHVRRLRLDRGSGARQRHRTVAVREAGSAGDVFASAASSKCGRRPASRTADGAEKSPARPRFSLTRFLRATTFRFRSISRRKAFLMSLHGGTRSC